MTTTLLECRATSSLFVIPDEEWISLWSDEAEPSPSRRLRGSVSSLRRRVALGERPAVSLTVVPEFGSGDVESARDMEKAVIEAWAD